MPAHACRHALLTPIEHAVVTPSVTHITSSLSRRGLDGERGGQADVAAARANHGSETSLLDLPCVGVHVPNRQGAVVECQHHIGGLSLREGQPFEALELLRRLAGTRWEAQVELRHLLACTRPSVLDRESDHVGRCLQVRVAESGEGEPVAKREGRLNVLRVVIAVAHLELLRVGGVGHPALICRRKWARNTWILLRRELKVHLGLRVRHRDRKPSRRCHVAPEQLGNGVAVLLSRKEGRNDARHAVPPGRQHRAGMDHHDDDLGGRRSDLLDQEVRGPVLSAATGAVRDDVQVEVLTVVALARICGDENDGRVRFGSGRSGALRVSARIVDDVLLRSDRRPKRAADLTSHRDDLVQVHLALEIARPTIASVRVRDAALATGVVAAAERAALGSGADGRRGELQVVPVEVVARVGWLATDLGRRVECPLALRPRSFGRHTRSVEANALAKAPENGIDRRRDVGWHDRARALAACRRHFVGRVAAPCLRTDDGDRVHLVGERQHVVVILEQNH
mmetsp:Transcript_51601/g.142835  ORF Transcript_51601/g.142835 Transcript_51601/m.142835 type:complete len:512 (-) Transcript_51601:1116-2651(-)|eukprot:2462206-Prymnesium_polylepis.1